MKAPTTNVEGRVIRHRKVVSPPGEAREDWKIICEIAKRLGQGDKFNYALGARYLRGVARRFQRRRLRLLRDHLGTH